MRTPVALGALVLLGSLSGCGQGSPVDEDPGFTTAGGDQRLAAAYDQDATSKAYRVAVPSGARHLRIRMDCVAKTQQELTVRVGPVGAGSVPCTAESSPGGFVALRGAPVDRAAGEQPVTISAPSGAHWSFAVDAG